MKIRNEIKIGVISVAGIIILLLGLNYLKGKGVFANFTKVYAEYNRVDGLVPSNPVLVNGFKIGQVDKVELKHDHSGIILVTMLIQDGVLIPKRSVARIISSDLLGSKAIELVYSQETANIKEGDTLLSDIQLSLQQQVDRTIAPIRTKAENLLASMDTVLEVIQNVFNAETRESLVHSFKKISSTIQALEHTSFALDTLVNTEKGRIAGIFSNIESISSNLKNNNQLVSNAIQNFSSISDSLAKANLVSTIENARVTLEKTASIMDKINKGEGSLGLLLHNDSLYNGLAASANDMDKLIVDMKENPKRYVQFSLISIGSGKAKAKKVAKKDKKK